MSGRGKAARVVGQIFTVSRLPPTGIVTFDPAFKCLLRHYTSSKDIENKILVPQVYELVCDVRKLQVGDILEELVDSPLSQPRWYNDVEDKNTQISAIGIVQQYQAPAYIVAQFRPIHKFMGFRLESFCQVRRGSAPGQVASDLGAYPTDDSVDGSTYQQAGRDDEFVLTLPEGSGEYVFARVNTPSEEGMEFDSVAVVDSATNPGFAPKPALIPFTLEPAHARGAPPFALPMDYNLNKWYFACPANWPGLHIRESDIIITPDGRRFRVHVCWEQHIGTVVTQGMVEKMES